MFGGHYRNGGAEGLVNKLREWLRERRESSEGGDSAVVDAIRPKCRNGSLALNMGRLCFVIPPDLKGEVLRICREENVTQGKLGLAMVEIALGEELRLRAAVRKQDL